MKTELIEKLKRLKSKFSTLVSIKYAKEAFELVDEAIALLEKPSVSAEEVLKSELKNEFSKDAPESEEVKNALRQAMNDYAGHSDAKTRLEKFIVCTDCYNVNISDPNCICCHSNKYEIVELEFEVCNCCNNVLRGGSPADTPFNKEQLAFLNREEGEK